MGLSAGLNMALKGMMTTEIRTNLASQNITNADKVGYTRKELEVQYMTSQKASFPVGGAVIGNADPYMVRAAARDTTEYTYDLTISNSLDFYSKQMGNTDGTNSLSSHLDRMYSALQFLATNPETAANKSEVITVAHGMAETLRGVSSAVQRQRLDVETKIAASIENINSILDRINVLNGKIANASLTNDVSLSEYKDQRDLELKNLSGEMDIQYFYDDANKLQIYSDSGNALLLSKPHYLNYTATHLINGTVTYPTGFSPITLDGIDMTTRIDSGKLGALINLRDTIYPDEQEKLDQLATVLKTQVNTLLNTGASVAPRSPMTGTLSGLTGASAFTATGSMRIAVTNNAGTIVNYADINLSAITTVSGLMTALNAVPGVSASLSGGKLQIATTTSGNGIAINPMTSSITSAGNVSITQYFGMNDLFTGNGAEDMGVSDYLRSNPELLAISVLSTSGTLAAGDRGVNRGDGSIADAIADILNSNVSFAAAGDFSAQTNSLQRYAQSIIASAASKADIFQRQADTSYQVYKASMDILTSSTGVNVDEETAKLLLYQTQYEAGARIVSTIQKMLQSLMDAVR